MDKVIAASKTKTQIVMFWGTFCGPCRMLKPVLEGLSDQYDITFIDVEKDIRTAQQHNIRAVPTVHIYYNGQRAGGFKGYLPAKRITDLLDTLTG